MYFIRCDFDGRKFHVVLTYFFDAISMDEKLVQLSRAHFDVFLQDKIWR